MDGTRNEGRGFTVTPYHNRFLLRPAAREETGLFYPAVTEELALLSHICNRAGVTLHLYARQVTAAEEDAIYPAPPAGLPRS